MKTITVQIQLDEAQLEVLTRESDMQKISAEKLLLDLIRQYIDELSLLARRPAGDHMAFVGMGNSDKSDVSALHDYYFGESIAKQHL